MALNARGQRRASSPVRCTELMGAVSPASRLHDESNNTDDGSAAEDIRKHPNNKLPDKTGQNDDKRDSKPNDEKICQQSSNPASKLESLAQNHVGEEDAQWHDNEKNHNSVLS